MRPLFAKPTLTACIKSHLAVWLWGPPGIGKSDIVRQIAMDLGISIIDLRAVLLDPVDLRGIPSVVNGRCVWCPPSFWPTEGEGIIFVDEFAQAPTTTQAAFMQGILDHQIGEFKLPPGWTWVAASNRIEDRAGANKIITPLLNRFIHVDMEVSAEDWLVWAAKNGIAPVIRAWIAFKHAALHDFDPKSGARAFASPRAYAFLSRLLPSLDDKIKMGAIAGTIGEGYAGEFTAFEKLFTQIPDPKTVLANPEMAPVPKDPSIMWSLCITLADMMKGASDDTLDALITYSNRVPEEMKILLVRDTIMNAPRVLMLPKAGPWIRENRAMIMGGAA